MNTSEKVPKELIITPDTKILDMITVYPQLEEKLIELAPVFIKLKSPFLRKTVARVTTIRQASVVGGLSLSDLIVSLRKEINQDSAGDFTEQNSEDTLMPEWINTYNKKAEYDAILDINAGMHPLPKVIAETAALEAGEYYLLITNFIPKPLIDTLAARGFDIYTGKLDDIRFGTYIRKN
jgi:hypothetical protein